LLQRLLRGISAKVTRADSFISAQARLGRQTRIGVALVVAVLHILAVFALFRAFAPDFTNLIARQVTQAFTVTVTTRTPPPPPEPSASAAAGAAGDAGRKAEPREAAAPRPKLAISPIAAPPIAGKGNADSSGARDSGSGTGAGGPGGGTGSGNGGSGQGGGVSSPVKIAGDINSARDYPRASRDLRIGDHVVVVLTVGTDGRASACRVQRPSRDPEADRITCRLAIERFRFRPATDAAGNPVTAVFGWQQRWFDPRAASEKADAAAVKRN
jgi:protein TonB